MDPKKVDSIINWPVPTCVKDIQSFLGLANFYRRFIPGFANLVYPLHLLLRKNVKFSWSPDAQASFDSLKLKFTSLPYLIYQQRTSFHS